MAVTRGIDRREFIVTTLTVGGGSALARAFRGNPVEAAADNARIPDKPWESLVGKSETEINPWLVFAPDDTVTIRAAQREMGQATFTSWSKMICEELECDWSKVRAEYASANRHFRENKVYGRMATNASGAVRISRQYLQQAGASARERLMAAAAEVWAVPRSELTVKDGIITHIPTGQKLRYGQVAQKAAAIKLAEEPKIKTPDQFTLMNKPTQLLETPLRVDGSVTYGMDVRLPGMLYAAAKASPVFLGKVKKYDATAVKNRPGVHSVVEFGGKDIEAGVAVVADSYWHAKTALDLLPIEWDDGAHGEDTSEKFLQMAHAALDEPGAQVVVKKGDPEAVLKGAAKVVEAVYDLPYLDHAFMEPMNCTAQVTADRVDVWVGTQRPEEALLDAAKLTGVPQENVYIHNCFIGGGFCPRKQNNDLRQAAATAQKIDSVVEDVWSREETMRHGYYRPMRVARFRAGLGPDGNPVAWINRVIGIDQNPPADPAQTVRGLHQVPYAVANQLFDFHF